MLRLQLMEIVEEHAEAKPCACASQKPHLRRRVFDAFGADDVPVARGSDDLVPAALVDDAPLAALRADDAHLSKLADDALPAADLTQRPVRSPT